MRVLADANILISYLLNPAVSSPPTRLVEAAIIGQFTLLATDVLLDEFIQRIATKPYLARRITQDEVAQFVTILQAVAEHIPAISDAIPQVTRDAKDDYLLAYAVVGQADYLVTGDGDLLVLNQVGGVKIVTPRQFVDVL